MAPMVESAKERRDGAYLRVRECFRRYVKVRAAKEGIPAYRMLEQLVAQAIGGRPWEARQSPRREEPL